MLDYCTYKNAVIDTVYLGNKPVFTFPLSGNPDRRLRLNLYADETGYRFWNSKKDPMPFKTRDNAGLKILEETPDYIQYICKNAVMTTAEQYVVGSYDTFMVRMRDIESSQELMRSYNISWTSQDSINLFHEINNAELEKISNTPIMLPENEENQPLILESKAVPVDYDCCFTVRKDDNYSFYINEGYEVYTYQGNLSDLNPLSKTSTHELTHTSEGGIKLVWSGTNDYISISCGNFITNPVKGASYTVHITQNIKQGTLKTGVNCVPSNGSSIPFFDTTEVILDSNNWAKTAVISGEFVRLTLASLYRSAPTGDVEVKRTYITKTNTSKPFVKSIQPNCKLSFVGENIKQSTHSFILKDTFDGYKSGTTRYSGIRGFTSGRLFWWEPISTNEVPVTRMSSSAYINANEMLEFEGGISLHRPYTQGFFKQLLIYENDERGGMTQAEMEGELAKDIKIR